ncbi:MAG TPA: serine/threonine-protein kinase [Actinomycetota bacterium]|nr:serine/threonine-protein kinase [Actinomycetota bacterium]
MQAGDAINTRYELEERLGAGGMGEVWRALDARLQRPVAIKFLDPRLCDDPAFLVRFFSEAQSAARINHPNVVAILDFGEHGSRPYLVMEHIAGGTLAGLTGQPVLPDRAMELAGQAALGAGAAHARGIVHRDIKPGNILLTEEGEAKLGDFGIAASGAPETLTATGTAIGSPHYVSPEQASGQGAVPASDVYSLGVVLYELVTGRRPFEGENPTAIAIAHVERAPAPPGRLVEGLEAPAEDIIMRCLEKDPGDRYADGNHLAAAIAATGIVLPGAGRVPPAPLEADDPAGARSTERRRRVLAGVVAGAAAVGALGLAAAFNAAGLPPAGGSNDSASAMGATSHEGAGRQRPRRLSPRPTSSATESSPSASFGSGGDAGERGRPSPRPRKGGTPSPGNKPSLTAEPSPSPSDQKPTPEPSPSPSASPTDSPTSSPSESPTPSPSPSPT